MTINKKNILKVRKIRVFATLFLMIIIGLSVKQTVFAEISESRGSFRLQVGQRRQLQSQGGSAPYRWSTSNSNVAVIVSSNPSSAYASVRAVGEGTATIRLESDKFVPTWYGGDLDTFIETWTVTVTAASNISDGTNENNSNTNADTNTGSANPATVKRVKLSKSSLKIKIGKTKSLTATLRPAGSVSRLTWTSSKPQVAAVNSSGQVTALKAGKTKITVTASNGKKAVCTVRVIKPEIKKIKLNIGKVTLGYGEKTTLRYTVSPQNANGKLTLKSSNTKVAKINKKGVITAKKSGKATITVKASSGVTAKCKVTVLPKPQKVKLSPKTLHLKIGDVRQLSAKLKPKKSASSLRWSSSNASVASVSTSGSVTAKKAGSVKITVKTINGEKATCKINVTAAGNSGNTSAGESNGTGGTSNVSATAVRISGAISYMKAGDTMNLQVVVSPYNTTDAVSWSSSNSSVASVSSNGVVRGLRKGGVTITARAGNCSASVKIAVVSGDVYDVSKGEILVLGDNISNDTVRYCGKEYSYNIAEGVTIVQSDPSKSNFIRIGGGKVTFANVHISGNEVSVVDYSRLEDSPYKGDIVIEFMDGTENYFSYSNAPISFMSDSSGTIKLILQGNGRADLYSGYGSVLSGKNIVILAPNLVQHTY